MKRLDKSDPKVAGFLETIAGVDARKPGPNLAGYVDAVFGITDDGGHRRSTVYLLRKTKSTPKGLKWTGILKPWGLVHHYTEVIALPSVNQPGALDIAYLT
jgi:hypothetical protein